MLIATLKQRRPSRFGGDSIQVLFAGGIRRPGSPRRRDAKTMGHLPSPSQEGCEDHGPIAQPLAGGMRRQDDYGPLTLGRNRRSQSP